MKKGKAVTYKEAGVDIDAGARILAGEVRGRIVVKIR